MAGSTNFTMDTVNNTCPRDGVATCTLGAAAEIGDSMATMRRLGRYLLGMAGDTGGDRVVGDKACVRGRWRTGANRVAVAGRAVAQMLFQDTGPAIQITGYGRNMTGAAGGTRVVTDIGSCHIGHHVDVIMVVEVGGAMTVTAVAGGDIGTATGSDNGLQGAIGQGMAIGASVMNGITSGIVQRNTCQTTGRRVTGAGAAAGQISNPGQMADSGGWRMDSDKGVAAVASIASTTGANRDRLAETAGTHCPVRCSSMAGGTTGRGVNLTSTHEWGANRIAGIGAGDGIAVTSAAVAAGHHLAGVDSHLLGGMDCCPGSGMTLVTLVDTVRPWQARCGAADQGASGRGIMASGAQTRVMDITCGSKWSGNCPPGCRGKISPGIMAGFTGVVGGSCHLAAMVMAVAAKAVDVAGGTDIRTIFPGPGGDGVQGATGSWQGPANPTRVTEGTGCSSPITMNRGVDCPLMDKRIGGG